MGIGMHWRNRPFAVYLWLPIHFWKEKQKTKDVYQGFCLWFWEWGVNELRPKGERSWLASRWRNYNVLHGYYFEEMRVADLAESLSIADQTFYDWRQQAILMLSRVLYEGLNSQEQADRCWQFVLNGRYSELAPPAQTLLRLLSLVTP